MNKRQSLFTDDSMVGAGYRASICQMSIENICKAKNEYETAMSRCVRITDQALAAQRFYFLLSSTMALALKNLGASDVFDAYVCAVLNYDFKKKGGHFDK